MEFQSPPPTPPLLQPPLLLPERRPQTAVETAIPRNCRSDDPTQGPETGAMTPNSGLADDPSQGGLGDLKNPTESHKFAGAG